MTLREHLNALCERGALRARVDGAVLHVETADAQVHGAEDVQGVVRDKD